MAMRPLAVGPLGWTFPASLILAALTVWGWLMFAVISRMSIPSCELLGRSAWLAASAAGTAACLFPITWIARPWLRVGASLMAAASGAAAAWWLTALLFPQFC
jgi:hypothetical protein